MNVNVKKVYSTERIKVIYVYIIKVLVTYVFFMSTLLSYLYNSKYHENKQMNSEINHIFKKFNKVNINDVYIKHHPTKIDKNIKIKSIINIEFTLDPDYILETMLTVTSIMATQKKTTKIVFHFGVINNFTSEKMLKMYALKDKINNLTEFNFYYLEEAMKKMKNFHRKGEACPGKFELPQLLPDNIEKILLFDAGDIIIKKDLTELYNYDMKNYWVLGLPEPFMIKYVKIYNIKKYLNIGALLINVTEFKKNKIWDKYTENRNLYLTGAAPDQTLLNFIIPDNKKHYFPFRLGLYSIFREDGSFEKKEYFDRGLKSWFASKSNLVDNPKTISEYYSIYNNSIFIHQFVGKWYKGLGLSMCRKLVKYFIKLAGIWEELCLKRPLYCI